MSENAISQMQMRYVPEEDRVLFRVNSADGSQFRLWLTRRYIQLLLQSLKKHLDSDPDISNQSTPAAKQAIQTFKQEQAIQGANFEKKFEEQAEQLPLGDTVVVAYRLNYRLDKETLHLGIEPKEGKGINLAINRDINMSLTRLILSSVKQADWRIPEITALPPTQKPVVN